jgi:DNA-binding transcriptional LysR family regulator
MEFRHIRSFLSVTETLNFGKSSRQLNLSQPALSAQIKALEEEVGVALFERDRQGTKLTAAGIAFRHDAEVALDRLDLAKRKAQWASAGRLGRVRLGFISTAGFELVPQMVRQFLKRFPDVEFSLQHILTEQQIDLLADGQIDIGFLRLPVQQTESLDITTVLREDFVAIVPSDHRLARREEIRLRELQGESFVLYSREHAAGYYDLLAGMLSRAGVVPKVVQSAGEMSTLISLVDAGVGISVVPETAARRLLSRVSVSTIVDEIPGCEIGMVVAKANKTPVVRHFYDTVRLATAAGMRDTPA